nr:unnamed protein product [Callosobruchus chinensis]
MCHIINLATLSKKYMMNIYNYKIGQDPKNILTKRLQNLKRNIIVWPYQNRNSILANALCNYSNKNDISITQKYLEP